MFSELKMLEVLRLPVGQLKANCYLVYDSESSDAIVIDPGDDAQFIINNISQNDLNVNMVLATHGHFDHIMAVNETKLAFDVPFLMAEEDQFLVERMRDSAKYFVKTDPGPPPQIDKFIKDGDIIKVGSYTFDVLSTPGHTPGGVSLYEEKEKTLFVGDLVFKEGLFGRTDFSYSDSNQLNSSVQKIMSLPENTMIYSGHGEKTSIKNIKLLLDRDGIIN